MKKEFTRMIVNTSFLLGIVAVVSAYTAPTVSPPGGNVPAPLNTGSAGQTKVGGLILNTGGATNGLIVQSGNVGIGTTNPLQKLDVAGNVNVSGCFMINGTCISSGSGGGGGSGVSQIVAGTNVTISPSTGTGVVTINASGGGGYWALSGSNIYNTNTGGVFVGNQTTINQGIAAFGGSPNVLSIGGSTGSAGFGQAPTGEIGMGISYGTVAKGSYYYSPSANALVVQPYNIPIMLNGNVGIGTASPSQKLEVAGNIKAGRFYMGDSFFGINVPGIGTDGTNVGVTTNGAFAVTNGGTVYQPVYAYDYYIASINKWASSLGGGQKIITGVVSVTYNDSQDADAVVSFGTTFTTPPVVIVTTKDRQDFTAGALNVTTTGATIGGRWVCCKFTGTVSYFWIAIGN